MTSLHSHLKQVGLLPVETFVIPALSQSVDSRHRIYGSQNVHKFNALRRFICELSCSEDRFKLRPNRAFGKVCNPDFSTFAQMSCGGRWTTQRFIAFVRIEREPNCSCSNPPR